MKVTLLTGCNLGNKEENMADVIPMIENRIGKIILKSAVYSSSPWGFESKDNFLNQAFVCETELSPHEILKEIWAIERHFGKTRGDAQEEIRKLRLRQAGIIGYQSRDMDIDLLFYDDLILESELLSIPHPHYQSREFVLEPLSEIMGNYIPKYGQHTIKEMLINLRNNN